MIKATDNGGAHMTRLVHHALIVLGVGLVVLTAPSFATASKYSHSAARFDQIAMLRVAMAYNLSRNAVDLTFPARSEDACVIAGVGALTYVSKDHGPWADGPEGNAFEDSVEAVLGEPNSPCLWLHSEAASEAVSKISRAWNATLKPNFKRLRKGLRKANCGKVYKALDQYPAADLPADRIHNKVKVVMGRGCEKAGKR